MYICIYFKMVLFVSRRLSSSSYNLSSLSCASLSCDFNFSITCFSSVYLYSFMEDVLSSDTRTLWTFLFENPVSFSLFAVRALSSLQMMLTDSLFISLTLLSLMTISISSECFDRQKCSLSLNFLLTYSNSCSSCLTWPKCCLVDLEKKSSFSFASS